MSQGDGTNDFVVESNSKADLSVNNPADTKPPTNQDDPNLDKEFVTRRTYKKALEQEKALRERLTEREQLLAKYQEKERIEEEERLKKQGEFKKILESREVELKKYKERTEHLERSIDDSIKLNAFLGSIPGKIKRPEYLELTQKYFLDKIVLNPENGAIDELSLNNAVNEFTEKFSDLIQPLNSKSLPNNASQPASSSISYEEWKKLPLKQKRESYAQVLEHRRKQG